MNLDLEVYHLRYYHTCHILHCEIKSHIIWRIWKPVPIYIRFSNLKSHRIFKPCYLTFYEEINIHNTLLCLSQISYIIIKAFDYFGRASK